MISDPSWQEVVIYGLNILQLVAITYLTVRFEATRRRDRNGG